MLIKDTRIALQGLRWLVATIYIYSAAGKFDYEFLHTVGQQFISAPWEIVGRTGDQGLTQISLQRLLLAALMPTLELAIGLGLLLKRVRAVAGGAAVILHLSLIAILGPWGLGHSWGVLLWNVQFAVQALLLFVLGSEDLRRAERDSAGLGSRLAILTVAFAAIMPITERWGRWDHWLSWALYAPHSSRAEIWVARTAIDRLPVTLRSEIEKQPSADALWARLPIGSWSLALTGTPVYPQARFQLGVARAIAAQLDSEFEISVELMSAANRINGRRTIVQLDGQTQIERASHRFWFNTLPRFHQ
jgi:hypothetical protein